MRSILLALALWFSPICFGATTDFFIDVTNGSNLNSGSSSNAAASFTFTSGTWDGTSLFTATGADLSAIVTNTMWASVYVDGATNTAYIGRIEAVDDALDTITVSTTAKIGTAPTVGASTRSIKVGGCMMGPRAAGTWPFNTFAATATNAAGDTSRVLIRGGSNHVMTAGVGHNVAGPIIWEGYTSTPGDGGRWTLVGTNGAAFIPFTASCSDNTFLNWNVTNNFTSGTTVDNISISGAENVFRRVGSYNARRSGFGVYGPSLLVEIETSGCGVGSATLGSIYLQDAGSRIIRAFIHDNSCDGLYIAQASVAQDCILSNNQRNGLISSSITHTYVSGCTIYSNAWNGIQLIGTSLQNIHVNNTLLFRNVTNAIGSTGTSLVLGVIENCLFGAGTQASATNIFNLPSVQTFRLLTNAVDTTPWIDPANGDFRLATGSIARGAGAGGFLTNTSYGVNMVGYPDIGAVQAITNSASSAAGNYSFGQ